MSNTSVAELVTVTVTVTVTITGTPVRAEIAEIAEILGCRTDFFGGRVADVRLADGTVARHVDTLDIEVSAAARGDALAAA